jgi:hypothetical protein
MEERQNRYAFTPYTWMALAFWAAQTVLQLYWVRNLFIYDETDVARLEALPYAPLYAAASVCFGQSSSLSVYPWLRPLTHVTFTLPGIYTFLFIYHYFLVALIFILAATSIQLWAVGQLPINTHDNLATQLNAKSAAAFAVLLCAQAFGVAFKLTPPPNTLAKALFGVFVGFAALTTDPLFGFGLVYDLFALTIGQHRLWASELTWITIAVGVVVAVKFMVFRVY